LKKRRKLIDRKIHNQKKRKNQKIYGDLSHLNQKRKKRKGIRLIEKKHKRRPMD
jgi:hypothetical protein